MARKTSPDKIVNVTWLSPTEAKKKKIRASKNLVLVGEQDAQLALTRTEIEEIVREIIAEQGGGGGSVEAATAEEVIAKLNGETE